MVSTVRKAHRLRCHHFRVHVRGLLLVLMQSLAFSGFLAESLVVLITMIYGSIIQVQINGYGCQARRSVRESLSMALKALLVHRMFQVHELRHLAGQIYPEIFGCSAG